MQDDIFYGLVYSIDSLYPTPGRSRPGDIKPEVLIRTDKGELLKFPLTQTLQEQGIQKNSRVKLARNYESFEVKLLGLAL
jgi:hypothetical protein